MVRIFSRKINFFSHKIRQTTRAHHQRSDLRAKCRHRQIFGQKIWYGFRVLTVGEILAFSQPKFFIINFAVSYCGPAGTSRFGLYKGFFQRFTDFYNRGFVEQFSQDLRFFRFHKPKALRNFSKNFAGLVHENQGPKFFVQREGEGIGKFRLHFVNFPFSNLYLYKKNWPTRFLKTSEFL